MCFQINLFSICKFYPEDQLTDKSERFIAAEIIREKGTNRSEFIRGEVQKYQWVDKGSSYLLAESLAAILLGSLEEFTKIQTSRQLIANTYTEKLSGWAKSSNFMLQPQNKSEINSAHMFYLVSESQLDREVFIEYLGLDDTNFPSLLL